MTKTDLSLFSTARNRLLAAFALALFCSVGFTAVSVFNRTRFEFHVIPAVQSLPLDAMIPFAPAWVWIYLLYYPFCFLPVFLREVREEAVVFQNTLFAFGLQFGISFAIFLLWPLRMRHPLLPSGIDGAILRSLYQFDLGFSSFPSLHVANIMFVSLLIFRLRGFKTALVPIAVALLIAASTLLVKQHFVFDVLLGALLGWGSFMIAFGRRQRRQGYSRG